MQVIVTRPAAQAADWVRQLQAHGLSAVALPLIAIDAVATPDALAALAAAWRDLPMQRAVVFVSPNAVARFFARRPEGAAWPAGVLAASPGPGTTHALRAVGVPPGQIAEPAADAPQFDSEALWAQLRPLDWQAARVLIVRGDGGRDWLAETLRAHGAQVSFVSAYRRAPPRFEAAETLLLRAAIDSPARFVWFFSSSEAIDHLATIAGPAAEAAWSASTAIATHPRIAATAQAHRFGRVAQTPPSLAAVVACIQSLRP